MRAESSETDTVSLTDAPTTELLVEGKRNIPKDGTVLSSYEDVYLVSVKENERAAELASKRSISLNTTLTVADDLVPANVMQTEEPVAPEVLNTLQEELETPAPTAKTRKQTVALIDTGVTENKNISTISMLGDDGIDRHGHGTQMAEEMLAINPNLEILSIKAMNDFGYGDVSTLYAAITYAMEQNVSIINLSISGYAVSENKILTDVIEEARNRGIEVVAAAGNASADVVNFIPGNIEDIYVIGACDENGDWLSISNWGETVDYGVTAPSTSVAAARFTAHLMSETANGVDQNGWLWSPVTKKDIGTIADGIEGGFKVAANVSATGLEQVVNNGYTYYVIPSKTQLTNADIWSSSGKWVKGECSFPGMNCNGHALYYQGTIAAGNGAFGDVIQIRFRDCISSVDNDTYDLLVTLSDIVYYTPTNVTHPTILAEIYETPLTTWFGAGEINGDPAIGVRMTVQYQIVKQNTNTPANGSVLLTFTDLDRPGFSMYAGGQGQFVEGISLLTGYHDPIYVEPNTLLSIENNGLTYLATETTTGYEQEKRAGCSFLAFASGCSFVWSGRSCWTAMNIALAVPQYTITPSKEGPGTIMPDSAVTLYKGQSKLFSMVADAGAHIKSITVDGVLVPQIHDGTNWITVEGQTSLNYYFNNVSTNHTIHVVFESDSSTAKTMIRYRDVNGNWSDYTQRDSQAVAYNGSYSYTWTRSASEPENVYEEANPKTVSGTNITSDQTYYMSVERKKYTYDFQFHPPGSHALTDITNRQADKSNQWAETMSGSAKTPALTGYTFLGWNTKADGSGSAYANEKMLSNKTFHARWEAKPYKVKYDGNGSSNPDHLTGEFTQNTVTSVSGMPASTFCYDTKGTLRTNDFVREGYTFIGWNTKADGTGTSYPDGYANVLNWSSTDGGEITLYAQWRKKLGNETLTVVSEETGNPVPGVILQLYKQVNGTWQALGNTKTTDANGQVSVGDLHWFDYEWRSVSVPAGYQGMTDAGFQVKWDHLKQVDERILYMEHRRLVLDSLVYDHLPDENPPAFLYQVSGTDVAGVRHEYDVLVQTGADGSGTNEVPDLFAGEYTVTQTPVMRYTPGNARAVQGSSVNGIQGTAKLVANERAEIEFPYMLRQVGYYGSVDSETNKVQK